LQTTYYESAGLLGVTFDFLDVLACCQTQHNGLL